MILPKPMTYAQILAGGVSFQLYNKSTNAVVPTSVSDGGGYIEITEDATSDHNTIYKIDQFAGAVSEITLYTEGDSAKTYALLGASQNKDVVDIRLFTQTTDWQEGEINIVYAEVNGKLYIPYVEDGEDGKRLNAVSPGIETVEDDNIKGFPSLFPKTRVEIIESTTTGINDSIKFLEFNDATANISSANQVVYKNSYDGDEPWRFGQDGLFVIGSFAAIRKNGEWYILARNDLACQLDEFGAFCVNSENGIYNVEEPQISGQFASDETIVAAKNTIRNTYGIDIQKEMAVTGTLIGEVQAPFEILVS